MAPPQHGHGYVSGALGGALQSRSGTGRVSGETRPPKRCFDILARQLQVHQPTWPDASYNDLQSGTAPVPCGSSVARLYSSAQPAQSPTKKASGTPPTPAVSPPVGGAGRRFGSKIHGVATLTPPTSLSPSPSLPGALAALSVHQHQLLRHATAAVLLPALQKAITAVAVRQSREAARLGGWFVSALRGLCTAPPSSRAPRASLPWVARRPASAVPALPGSEGRALYYDPSEAPHHYVWSTKMSRARVYADVNTKRPRSYWDYENMTVTWGYVAALRGVGRLAVASVRPS